jgi:hypothetical protein
MLPYFRKRVFGKPTVKYLKGVKRLNNDFNIFNIV